MVAALVLFVRVIAPLCILSGLRRNVAMAWMSSGNSNGDLIARLKRNGIIQTPSVEAAMRKVDRKNYCPYNPFQDSPQSIGYGATISAPHMHAHALELLKDHLREGATALDVGSGTGYLTACMAHMIGESGCSVGIEHIKELNDQAIKNVEKDNPELLKSESTTVHKNDHRIPKSIALHIIPVMEAAAASICTELGVYGTM